MNDLLDKASILTGNASISETGIDQLEQLANEHPYFSVIQVLLAKKYKLENHIKFLPQVQKAALYFNNPYWLHYQLLEHIPEITLTEQDESAGVITGKEKAEDIKEQLPHENNIQQPEPKVVFTPDEFAAASTLARQTLAAKASTNTEQLDEVEITPDELHPEKEEILEEIQEQSIKPEQQTPEDTGMTQEAVVRQKEEHTSVEILPDKITPTEEEKQAEISLSEKDLIATVVEDTLIQPVLIDLLDDVESLPVDSAVKPGDIVASDLPAPGEPLIPIEPYYTVDYFASQGIKLSLDKNPQDKLGKQLRSFTDWLKHMKKIGPEDALTTTQDTEVDSTIKNIADTSNTPKEIITEAMADVLIKQGKKEQAIEVYNKLSFLNPDKSTYFADQIQKLKGS